MAITPTAATNTSTPASNNVVVLTDQLLPVSDHSSEESTVWVTIGRCVLHVTDKLLIENGSELMDKHTQFAQNLIKSQHSSIGGLHLTILQKNLTHVDVELPTQFKLFIARREGTVLLYQPSGVRVTRWQSMVHCLPGWTQKPESQS